MKQANKRIKKSKNNDFKREQPRKDSKSRRVNLDNERVSRFTKDIEKEFDRKDGNSVEWYTKNRGLIAGSTSIPFNTVLGSEAPFPHNIQVAGVPGLMAFKFVPNFVPDDGFVINQCAQSYYSEVVHANSRNQSYDPADLMIVTMAGAQIFAAIGNMIRAYGVMQTYSAENRYMPEGLINSMGFQFSDLKKNISHMLFDINQLIAQSRQIWIPNTFPIINRWFWMNSMIYTDADSIKPQLFLYSQAAYYKYSGFTDRKGGELVLAHNKNVFSSNATLTWQAWIDMVQSMLDALINDQDRGIMFGDILKCYGADKIFVLNEIGLDYRTEITYSKEVLWQFENLICGAERQSMVLKLTQDTNGKILQSWTTTLTTANYNAITHYRPDMGVINFHQKEQPTSEQILVATRMMALGNREVDSDNTAIKLNIAKTAGTEICLGFRIYGLSYGSNHQPVVDISYIGSTMENETSAKLLMQLNSFDWRPSRYNIVLDTTHPTGMPNYFNHFVNAVDCEYDNYTYIDVETLKRIHLTAIYSLFNVPLL